MSAPTITTTKPVITNGILGKREVTSYVDPHPGQADTDRVPVPCWKCVDKSGHIRAFAHVYGGVCFGCNGTGVNTISVRTARRHAKADAYATEFAAEIQAHHAAQAEIANAAKAAAEFEAAWDTAHAENTRRSALVQGFIGQVDEKIATGPGTVQVAKYIEGSWNRSSSMFLVVKLDSGQVVKIFGSSQTLFGLERGYRVTLTGKVKKHESYQGQDQTVLGFAKATVLVED
jgi:hypothetical protein